MSNVSESLISLTKNERMSDSLKKFWLKKSKILFFSMFYIQFFYLKNEGIAHSLFFGERCEWITQVTHQKWVIWANRSGRSPKMSDHERYPHIAQMKWAIVSESLRLLTKNEQMSESLVFLRESLICSFLGKKRAIRLENRWAKSLPWFPQRPNPYFSPNYFTVSYPHFNPNFTYVYPLFDSTVVSQRPNPYFNPNFT